MTLCKNGHERRPENVDKYRRCITCFSDYQKQYRATTKQPKKNPISDWQPKEKTTRPLYFPDIIMKTPTGQGEWYERSRQQMKLLSGHKYAVKSIK